jgi:hypothetical protein
LLQTAIECYHQELLANHGNNIEEALNNLNLNICLNNLHYEKAFSKIRPSLTIEVRDWLLNFSIIFIHIYSIPQ